MFTQPEAARVFQSSSGCGKAVSARIPRSIQKYVTGVSKRNQRRHSLKYEGKPEEARRPGNVCEEPVLRPHARGNDAEMARCLVRRVIGCRG
ncbi:hypothetical protein EJD93_18935 [Cronobacter sakazakii]|nr:hypothetical protein [Cronobacter sakazakii]NCH12133.1 hypothetical protein [Cronobacter sakazakii]NCH35472.1 hypothetical protein [Cronobacter sakazakii]NCH79833.1 hypothetical protein [Cronobacter sakazakii]UEQ67738.1 hypothetical protein EJD93_18935 [Cronobacter sakazakii]